MIKYVWAEDLNGGIGYENHLPWRMPADLHHFKEETIGHPILMGRKTFESLPKILPGRKHYVLTHDQNFAKKYRDNDDVEVLLSTEAMLKCLAEHQDELICAIGGVSIFAELIDQVDILERTIIDGKFTVDTYMPKINYVQFELVKKEAHDADKKNPYAYTYLTYHRKSKLKK